MAIDVINDYRDLMTKSVKLFPLPIRLDFSYFLHGSSSIRT